MKFPKLKPFSLAEAKELDLKQYYILPKYDGVAFTADSTGIRSRNDKPFGEAVSTNFRRLITEISKLKDGGNSITLYGELVLVDSEGGIANLNLTNGSVHSTFSDYQDKYKNKGLTLKAYIWWADVNAPIEEKDNLIRHITAKMLDVLDMRSHSYIAEHSRLEEFYYTYKNIGGYDGIVLRHKQYITSSSRTNNMIKIKFNSFARLKALKVFEGKGKHVGFINSIQFEWNGIKFNAGLGKGWANENLIKIEDKHLVLGQEFDVEWKDLSKQGCPQKTKVHYNSGVLKI